jgi:NRPS condensation-like uncharacterized protein
MPIKSLPGGLNEPRWLPLDNAAKIFPSGTRKTRSLVFRISSDLNRRVNFDRLFEAASLTAKRYPYFTMHLRRGFFWYWLEEVPGGTFQIMPDEGEPCKEFKFGWSQNPLCRILARDFRISAEFYHVITDGTGALEFFKTLLATYAELSGIKVPKTGFNHYTSEPDEGETIDAYNTYFDPRLPAPPRLSKAFHVPFPFASSPRLSILTIEAEAGQIKGKAQSRGVTLTEYLVSIYLMVLQDIFEQMPPLKKLRRRPVIRIQVPVNLRSLFPSNTLRNFALFVTPEIDMRLGHYTFEEVLHTVHHFMQHQTDPKLMQKIIYRNVRNEKSLFIRIIPLILKDRVLNYYFKRSGMSLYSGLLTNLGRLDFSDEFGDTIERFLLLPPPPDATKISLGVVTYRNRLIISFSNSTKSIDLEKRFIHYLQSEGIAVKLLNH